MKIALLACLISLPAAAAQPQIVPTRDVTVTYMVQPRDHKPLEVRVSIAAGGDHLRITAENLPTAFLVDRRAHVATILLPMLKLFTTVSLGDKDDPEEILQGARFERHGADTVAGRSCTDWTAESNHGHASACITDDGVILRGHASNHHGDIGTVLASTVQYGRLSPTLFDRPAGFSDAGPLPIGKLTGLAE
jgi:hypothetical protein